MTTARESKRILIEQGLATYYRNKFAQQTGRKPEEYASLWVSWDDNKRAYNLRGEGLPSHPDLAASHPNGWCLSDYIKPTEAAKLLKLSKPAREQSKRILSVTVKREADYDGDHSDLGEYSDTPNDYAIVNENARGTHGGQFVDQLPCECGLLESEHKDVPQYIGTDPASDFEVENPDYDEDTCHVFDRVEIERGREYRYFNPPVENYEGESDEDIRKYSLQDYDRMQAYNNQQWCYMGVRASAEVQLDGPLCQTITSGGLWSIESDSGDDYFAEVEGEQLEELKAQLYAIGFTKRAIAAAMRNVERKEY